MGPSAIKPYCIIDRFEAGQLEMACLLAAKACCFTSGSVDDFDGIFVLLQDNLLIRGLFPVIV